MNQPKEKITEEQALRLLAAVERHSRRDAIWEEVVCELDAQDEKWGPDRDLPNGTGHFVYAFRAKTAKQATDGAAARGEVTWQHIANEELLEAFAEGDPARIREELIQAAAVLVQWIDAIDRQIGEH